MYCQEVLHDHLLAILTSILDQCISNIQADPGQWTPLGKLSLIEICIFPNCFESFQIIPSRRALLHIAPHYLRLDKFQLKIQFGCKIFIYFNSYFTEACIYAFYSIAEHIDSSETKYIPKFIVVLSEIPYDKLNEKLLGTAIDSIGNSFKKKLS